MPIHIAPRSWGLLVALGLAALVRPACDAQEGTPDPTVTVALGQVLSDLWPEVVAPALARSHADADALVAAVEAWAAAPTDTAAHEAAREAWRVGMTGWQQVELLQLGPLGSSLGAKGGQDLRDEIYSWPTVSPCRVDQETVGDRWSEPDFLEVALVNVQGLDALETLLFSPAGENACSELVDINLDGSWAALGPDGVEARRAGYARVLARGVRDRIVRAEAAWDPSGEDFAGEIGRAGEEGSPYESPEQALNAIFDALFYLETRTKDDKLGAPLGLVACAAESCLDQVETRLAGGSQVWIAENLRGFRALFTGGNGAGVEDLLRSLGEGDLADRMLAALDTADGAAAALAVPVDEAAVTDPTAATELYAAIKAVTDLLKGDLATVLALRIPAEAAGDND